MTYQEALDFIKQHRKEWEFDSKEKIEFLIFIAPTDPKQYEFFSRDFVLNCYDPNSILPFINEDVCVMRVAKEYLKQRTFMYQLIKS